MRSHGNETATETENARRWDGVELAMSYVERKAAECMRNHIDADDPSGTIVMQLEAVIRDVIEDCAREASKRACTMPCDHGVCVEARRGSGYVRALAAPSTTPGTGR